MKKNNFYTKYFSTHYKFLAGDEDFSSYQKRYYLWKSYLQQFLPENKNTSILEIGCGTGFNLFSLMKMGYKNAFGIDVSPECITICKKMNFNCLLIDKSNEEKFYRDCKNKFNIVILYDILEHYSPEDASDILLQVKTVLNKDGLVIISLPNADHPFSNTLLFADITHKFIYNEKSLSQLLRNCGFKSMNFWQINSYTTIDNNILKQIFKSYVLKIASFLGEKFWILIGISQGILLKECKPTLICLTHK